jgi:galactokinase
MPRKYRAPGRVNLIGDHTDYNGGFVMPMAIQLETTVTHKPRPDQRLVIRSSGRDDAHAAVDLGTPLRPRHDWSDYVVGVAYVLQAEGRVVDGADLAIESTVPQGSGLSSSAALEVASALALLNGQPADRLEVARWCQRAENEFVGARCGIMDQYIACLGRAGHALLIDCRSLEHQPVPIPPDVAVIVSNSMVKHSVAAGEYNTRRAQCEEAVAALRRVLPEVRSLRDVQFADLTAHRDLLSSVALKRARHVVSENARVTKAADAFSRQDFEEVGRLMRDSHTSLRDDFEVTVAEIDLLVDIANGLPGVYGSRMTGGGFGGCTVTLAAASSASAVQAALRAGYAEQSGTHADVMICTPSAGASEITA